MYGNNGIPGKAPGLALNELFVRGLVVIDIGRLHEAEVQLLKSVNKAGDAINLPDGASYHYGVWATLTSK